MHDLRHSVIIRYLRAGLVIDVVVLLQQPLQRLVRLYVVLLQSQNLKCLLFRYKAALDAQPLLGDGLSAFVRELFGLVLVMLLIDEFQDALVALSDCQRADHSLES